MAKKRRQKSEKKDETEFNFPEFDEHQYITLELNKAKISLVAFVFAIVMALISFQLYSITYPDARAPFVLGLFSVVALPFIARFVRIDVSDFDWKNWLGGGAVYVFSWLAIFIVVVNPPFSDFVEPEIEESIEYVEYVQYIDEQVINENGTEAEKWIPWDEDSDPNRIGSPIKINFTVKIFDNSPIEKDSVRISIDGILNNTISNKRMYHEKNNVYRLILENSGRPFPERTYDYKITAKDSFGHKTEKTGQFQII